MKRTKLIFTLFVFSSIIIIDAGQAMMLELAKNTSRIVAKKRVASPMMQKRYMNTDIEKLKTKGFKPESPIEATNFHVLKLPKKLEYIDENQEIFEAPEGFQETLEKSLYNTQKQQSSNINDPLKKK